MSSTILKIFFEFLVIFFEKLKFYLSLLILQLKYTKPITIGETILPNNIPNLNQILFSGVRIFELNNPNNKKIILTTSDQILKFPSFNRG